MKQMVNFIQLLCLAVFFCSPLNACSKGDEGEATVPSDKAVSATVYTSVDQVPVLTGIEDNTILKIKLQVNTAGTYDVRRVKISLNGTTDLNDIESVRLFYTGTDEKSANANRQFGKISQPEAEIIFEDELRSSEPVIFFKLTAKLKDQADLLHRIDASCELIQVNATNVVPAVKSPEGSLKAGLALRRHGDDNVHTYRIPGLTTTGNGTLLAIYDARRESSRDLQGNMDIGLSRSTDGGNSWEPMRIVLDKGAWGGLPEKFNGVSDACILVDENTNTIFVAGLWMYGVINSNGEWVEGLTESSSDWNHQWRDKGSQPGFDVKQTSQFLITRSTDDGQTWSEPVNLTRMCKKEAWWLWAPAPGHGITLDDGTLVFPTQGRDENGESFSNITWSKDGGQTWTTSNVASRKTTENMVAQLSDGTLMINARLTANKGNTGPDNGRVISISRDLGQSWTEHPSSRNALIEPACMASLHKHEYMENGQKKSVLLFSNPDSRTNRDHMTIKLSFDNGETWPEKYRMLLDEGKGRGYSCLTSVDEQTIGILYEGSGADLIFQKITLQELIKK